MISSIRIENLRSLKDTKEIELRPINILIGGNSSGKSTFLRTFPLLSQTVSHNLRTAIAWYDESSVDFGDFATSKTRDIEEDYIKFSFFIKSIDDYWIRGRYPYRLLYNLDLSTKDWNLSLSYKQRSDGKGVFINQIEVENNKNHVKFIMSEKKTVDVILNGRELPHLQFLYYISGQPGLIPHIFCNSSSNNNGYEESHLMALSPLLKFCSPRIKHTERLLHVWDQWDEDINVFLTNLHRYHDLKTLMDVFNTWDMGTEDFQELYESIYAVKVLDVLQLLNHQLRLYFDNCDYVAPLRAEASRYTRFQGLQVNRVDAFGRNLSEFIDSLTDKQRDSLNEYIENALGVKVRVRNVSGHQSMTLTRDSKEYNMADVGFGYSQILPIITKLWQMQERKRFNTMAFYRSPFAVGLIEQPELHLHPALQAKLADAFVKAAINEDSQTTLIIETHSPTIINRIGRRVREGHICADNVNVIIFDKDPESGHSKVSSTKFLPNGRIEDWPSGFFEPENDTF